MFAAIADALSYPTPETAGRCRTAALGDDSLARAMAGLGHYLESTALWRAEERYTTLFDLNPVASLYVGWHLFGDAYARGALMAGLAAELTRARVAFAHDLPDFLPSLLRLLDVMPESEGRVILAHAVVLPGVAKIVAGLEHSDAPWAKVLSALGVWLEREIPKGEVDVPSVPVPEEARAC